MINHILTLVTLYKGTLPRCIFEAPGTLQTWLIFLHPEWLRGLTLAVK
jgi:hypothetical protein